MRLLIHLLAVSGAAATALDATRRWIDHFVIGMSLCPWASRESTRGFRLLATSDADHAMRLVVHEARGLASRADAQQRGWPTSLVVCDDPELDDLREFARFCRRAQRRCGADDAVALLGFHPLRLDSGPGCSSDAADAGHFSVRSPYPLVQVLREADLAAAREQWASRNANANEPGALGLLMQNKRRLRAVGQDSLQLLLRACCDDERDRGA